MSHCSVWLVAGVGPSCPGQFILTPIHLVTKYNHCTNSTYFKLSECEDVSIINIIQAKFSSIFVALFRMFSCRGGGQAVQGSLF